MAVIDNYGPNEQAFITLFSAVFNKAPTPDLIALGASELANGATHGQILDLLFNYPDVPFTAYKASAPTNAFVTALVDNLTAGGTFSAETKASWVALLAPEVDAFANYGDFAATVVSLITGITWEEGTELAALSANIDAKAEAAAGKSYNSTDTYTGWANLDGVTAGGDGEASDSNVLTYGTDYLFGHDVYNAPVVQNPTLGNVTNTLETGDTILGNAGGGGVLNADLTLTTTGGIPVGPAISSITNNIDKIVLRAQTGNVDQVGAPHDNNSHIDAERNVGVKEWWTQDSRASIQVEDVRTLPEDTTIGVRNTDPHVGFRVYFDPAQLIDRVSSESTITLTLGDVDRPGSLEFVPIDGVGFYIDGEPIVLRSTAIGEAKTYEAFVAALKAAAAAVPAAAGLVITLNPDNSISVNDPAGGTFTKGGWQFIDNSVPADGNLFYTQVVGDPTLSTEPVTTGVVLDAVGRTSQGGTVDIGSLGDGGVERFNVAVDRNSWVTALESTEHLGNFTVNGQPARHLEIVNFTSIGAKGDVKVGNVSAYINGEDAVASRPGLLDGRVHDGLIDVRVVDGSAFEGKLNLGITLTFDSVWRYLDGATEPVQFNYTGSAQNDLFNVNISSSVASDPDFRGDIDLGAGDDRLVFSTNGGYLKNVSVDGGEGNNTFVIRNTDVGFGNTAAQRANYTFASFENFANYEVEGGSSNHDFANLQGVENVVVALDNGSSTILRNLPAAIDTVTVTGKNQTVDPYGNNGNADQFFNAITLEAAKAAELTVALDNTARLDGELEVNVLSVIDQPSSTNQSAVRTLNIESNGERDTTNVINSVIANRVTTFNLTGTQDLDVTINNAANFGTAGAANLVVNGSEAEGNLTVGINAAIVNDLHARDKTMTFTAGAGEDDNLVFVGGALNVTKALVTASGFETVTFEDGGKYNAVNTTGVTLYESLNGDALQIINLRNEENVKVGDKLSNNDALSSNPVSNAGGDQAFVTNAFSAASKINIDVIGSAGVFQKIETDGYTTLGLHLTEDRTVVDAQKAYLLDLGTQSYDSVGDAWVAGTVALDVPLAAPVPVNHISRVELKNVVVTGGTGEVVGGVSTSSANLGTQVSTVQLLDLSGYKGSVIAGLSAREIADVTTTAGTTTYDTGNTVVKVGAFGIDVQVQHAAYDNGAIIATSGKVVTFEFTADAQVNAAAAGSTNFDWVIRGFQGVNDTATVAGGADGGAGNVTVLDVAALGARTLADLKFTDVAGDLHITSNTAVGKFDIVLVGVDQADVGLENFKFAA